MTPTTHAKVFEARTHSCSLVQRTGRSPAGWFGGGPAPKWKVPPSSKRNAKMAVVAVVELGTISDAWAGARAVLYIDPHSIGDCAARLERTGDVDTVRTDPRTCVPVPFSLGSVKREKPWLPHAEELGRLGCKIGGRPGYLQQELEGEARLAKRGFAFVAQLDCEERDVLPERLAEMLCDGALYLFARRKDDEFDFRKLQLHWQF